MPNLGISLFVVFFCFAIIFFLLLENKRNDSKGKGKDHKERRSDFKITIERSVMVLERLVLHL